MTRDLKLKGSPFGTGDNADIFDVIDCRKTALQKLFYVHHEMPVHVEQFVASRPCGWFLLHINIQ
jgi:hypothetical protein